MVNSAPQTIADDLYGSISEALNESRVLLRNSSEYFLLRRRADDLNKAAHPAGFGASAALCALVGDVSGFLGFAEESMRTRHNETEKLFFIMLANILGESKTSRRLLALVDFDHPSELGKKIILSQQLFDLKRYHQALRLADRTGTPLPASIEGIMNPETVVAMLHALGIDQAKWDAINDLAAKAALKSGVLLARQPFIRYDMEDGFLSVAYDVPLDMDKIFEIESHLDEMTVDHPVFANNAIAISFHMDIKAA